MSAFDQEPQENNNPAPNQELLEANARTAALEQRLAHMEQTNQQQAAQQQLAQRNQQLSNRGQAFEAKVTTSKDALDAAEVKLRNAYDDEAEPAVIAKAQRDISVAAAELTRASSEFDNFKTYLEGQLRQQQQPPAEAPAADPTNLQQWKTKNTWYETDPDMTATANAVDKEVRARGEIPVGSLAYFDEIDRKVREKHADKFDSNPGQSGGQGMPTLSSGRDAGGSTAPGSLRMDPNMQRAAERMGLTPEQWAKGRETAVSKGILASTPIHSRVL